jgi:hypothetical protein
MRHATLSGVSYDLGAHATIFKFMASMEGQQRPGFGHLLFPATLGVAGNPLARSPPLGGREHRDISEPASGDVGMRHVNDRAHNQAALNGKRKLWTVWTVLRLSVTDMSTKLANISQGPTRLMSPRPSLYELPSPQPVPFTLDRGYPTFSAIRLASSLLRISASNTNVVAQSPHSPQCAMPDVTSVATRRSGVLFLLRIPDP